MTAMKSPCQVRRRQPARSLPSEYCRARSSIASLARVVGPSRIIMVQSERRPIPEASIFALVRSTDQQNPVVAALSIVGLERLDDALEPIMVTGRGCLQIPM